ncbi:JAB domain-containing protein [Chryseolinea lacunae]|uniref:JAB domain-containing protein n=1 Tax=Chryseolinea lacunae TaxID=2801331 RepID=A0ABS1KPA8_9BACT|nr:JAB domain-containing protein [Chryseolinea lacunae]MBL0741072.1 JAB domain-containing protein [Chryseolinea lacunae]
MENNTNQSKQFEVAEIELSYKSSVKPSSRAKISSSKDAGALLMQSWDMSKIELVEQFKILFVNRANRVLGIYELSTGGMSATVVDPKLIFVAALKVGASGIILSHNHPSGNLTPSQADISFTKRISEGGKLLEIQLMDHIIVTSESYYSFADEGLL